MNNLLIKKIDKKYLIAHLGEFLEIVKDIPNEYWTKENFLSELPGKWDFSFYVSNSFEKLIGYIIVSDKIRCVHIHKLMVHHDFRGKNIGHELLSFLESHLKTANKSHLSLKVSTSNLKAIKFYVREGFNIVNNGELYLEMEKDLLT